MLRVLMQSIRIILIDKQPELVEAWDEAFSSFENVSALRGDFFSQDASAMVSPANSFGVMDGGLDRAIRDKLGYNIERQVQAMILKKYHGEMPVGAAEIVKTSHERWPNLIVAPTMRVPENVAHTHNAFHAFRAILGVIQRFNNSTSGDPIDSVLVPGLATGWGAMAPRKCAAQMRLAYNVGAKPARIPSFDQIHALHNKLKSL